jgi:RNA polymerase sigma factor (sigma-70 family)
VLLSRYVCNGDEAAFAALVRRHGRMLLGVCRRLLPTAQDAEDVVQATVLVLARKAGTVRPPDRLAAWLHGVARNLALKHRAAEGRRRQREARSARHVSAPAADPLDELSGRELLLIIDEELQRLPEAYRLPLILCYLEGRTQEEAARQLGWTPGSVKGRLERGRARLHARLLRRGLPGLVGLEVLQTAATASMSPILAAPLVKTALAFASAQPPAEAAPAHITDMAQKGIRTLSVAKAKFGLLLILGVGIVSAGAAFTVGQVRPGDPPNEKSVAPVAEQPSRLPEQQEPELDVADNQPPGTDRYGDPLPEGAVARLGTLRFRQVRGWVDSLQLSSDGKTLLSSVTPNGDSVCVWEVPSGKLLRRFAQERRVAALSPNGKTVAVAHDSVLQLWDVASGREVRQLNAPVVKPRRRGNVQALAFSPDGKTLASTHGFPGVLCLWDVAAGTPAAVVPAAGNSMTRLIFSPDGKTLVAGNETQRDAAVHIFDVEKRQERQRFTRESSIRQLAISPDGALLAVAVQPYVDQPTSQRSLSLWDLGTGKLVRELPSWRGVSSVAFAPDGKTLVTAEHDQKTREALALWDVSTGKEIRRLNEATRDGNYSSWSVIFSADGKTLIVGCSDGIIRLTDVASGEDRSPAPGNPTHVSSVAVAPNGRTLAYHADVSVRLWDLTRDRELAQLSGAHRLAFSPDSKLLAGAGSEGINLWDVAGRKLQRTVPKGGFGLFAIAPDGRTLATSQFDFPTWRQPAFFGDGRVDVSDKSLKPGRLVVRRWDLTMGTEMRLLSLDGPLYADAHGLAFLADGKLAVSGRDEMPDGRVWLWDLRTGKLLPRLSAGIKVPVDGNRWSFDRGHWRIASSPNGKLLALCGPHELVSIREAATGKERLRLGGHPDGTVCVAFSADGWTLASSGWDETIRLWDLASGKELRKLTGHRGAANSLAFTPDGRRLISAGDDSTILFWDVAALTHRRRAEHRLTQAEWQARWADLAGADALNAHQAIIQLIAAPETTVANLKARLAPAVAPDPARLERLVRDLESAAFADRSKASHELLQLADLAQATVDRALARPEPSLEARRRLEQLRDQLEVPAGDVVRGLRALEVLEHIVTPPARRLLAALAAGAAEARMSREAKAALARLDIYQR